MAERPGSSPEVVERSYTDALAEMVRSQLTDVDVELEADVAVLRGDAADAILDHAARLGASLVVVGARGSGGATRAILGSVSSHLTSCPIRTIAVIPAQDGSSVGALDAPLVVGIDGSDGSSRAVRWAADTARHSGREVVVVHVVEFPIADPTEAQMRALTEESSTRARREWCAPLIEAGVPHRVVIESGSASDALRRVATEVRPSAVVVGSRGRGPISQRLLGSVTHRLLRVLESPVVVVPSSRDCPIWQP